MFVSVVKKNKYQLSQQFLYFFQSHKTDALTESWIDDHHKS